MDTKTPKATALAGVREEPQREGAVGARPPLRPRAPPVLLPPLDDHAVGYNPGMAKDMAQDIEDKITQSLLKNALSELRELIDDDADGLPHGIVKKLESIEYDLASGLGKWQ